MARAKTRTTTRTKTAARRTRATTRAKGARAKSARAGGTRRRGSQAPNDAIALLKADHRAVEGLFQQFEKARTGDRKRDLATKVCDALRVHAQIEEEIFYPAFYEATDDDEIHHEAIVEHDGAKKLIAEIEASGPEDEYYDARVTVLSEMIKHHVKEEEQSDGMFAKARRSGMDLVTLGERLAERKAEIESTPELLKSLGRAKEAGKGVIARLTSSTGH